MKEKKNQNENLRAAIYLRLSKEDINKQNKEDESESIKNQRLMLLDYANSMEFKIADIYSDDNESGLYDDRPEFTRLIEDSRKGKFEIVIAKSQSRFTRNNIHAESYFEEFELNHIRFIGLTDCVDTFQSSNKKARQVNGIVNEWYSEDTSKNIRKAKMAKMKNGLYISASSLYGYVKDSNNHNKLLIDEYAAGVVKRIFNLYLSGYGKRKIASILSDEGVLIPSVYKEKVLGQNYYNPKIKDGTRLWSYQTIHNILKNEMYIGNMVQNRSTKISYKSRKKINLPKDEWVIVENTHDPIIEKEDFFCAQKMLENRRKELSGIKNIDIFTGMLYCKDCGHPMQRIYNRNNEMTGYVCGSYKMYGKKYCNSHMIKNDELRITVFQSIIAECTILLTIKDFEELMTYRPHKESFDYIKNQLCFLNEQIKKIEKYKEKNYYSFIEDLINKEEYLRYNTKFEDEINQVKKQTAIISDSQDEINNLFKENNKELIKIQKVQKDTLSLYNDIYQNIFGQKLTRELVVELINKIEILNDGEIIIYYKFENNFN